MRRRVVQYGVGYVLLGAASLGIAVADTEDELPGIVRVGLALAGPPFLAIAFAIFRQWRWTRELALTTHVLLPIGCLVVTLLQAQASEVGLGDLVQQQVGPLVITAVYGVFWLKPEVKAEFALGADDRTTF